jgi:hypothetical protein
MERRGRERKRSVLSHVKRREEAVGQTSVDSGYEDLAVPKLVSKGLGLGFRATAPYGAQGMEIIIDLKMSGNVAVKKVPSFTR